MRGGVRAEHLVFFFVFFGSNLLSASGFVFLTWCAGERMGHSGRELIERGEGDVAGEEETEDEALGGGGQSSISTPSERKRSVRQHLPHYRPNTPLRLT